jgi:cytochrome c6
MFSSFFVFFTILINFNFFEKGEKLFSTHCLSCHIQRNNIILPEKNLKKETLENFGINNKTSLVYQIINGKNGMPAFGGKLKQIEIAEIISYLLK